MELQSAQSPLIRVDEVMQLVGVRAKSTIWKWSKEMPDFPKPRRIGTRFTVWSRPEVEAYVCRLAR